MVWRKESRCPGLKDASKCYRPIIHPKSLTLGSVGYFDDYIFVPWSIEISREIWWLEPIYDRFSQATPVSYASAAGHRAGASACHIHKNPLTMHEHLFCNMPCTSLVVFFFTKIVRKLPIADCLQFLTGANLLGHHFLICFAWSIFKPSFCNSFLVKWRFIIIKRMMVGFRTSSWYYLVTYFAK